MMNRIINYNGINIIKKENFDNIYNNLKTQNYLLLCSNNKIITNRDFTFASTITTDKQYFYWRHYGSSANRLTKTDLKWILQNIFDDCNYFKLIQKTDWRYNYE